MLPLDPSKIVTVRYTNYRGETSIRRIIPLTIRFAISEWHPGEQWLMDVLDVEKGVERTFALDSIEEWRPEDSRRNSGLASRVC